MGLTGPNAAGKGEVARFLVEQGYTYHSLSDVVRRRAAELGLSTSREHLVRVGNELRAAGGVAALVDRLLPDLEMPAVIDSIRNPGEVTALQQLDGFLLLAVLAPDTLRFERMQARGRAGDLTTLADFQRYETRENSAADGEQRINDTVARADVTVANDGSFEQLRDRVTRSLAHPR